MILRKRGVWGRSPHLKGGLGGNAPSLGCFSAYIGGGPGISAPFILPTHPKPPVPTCDPHYRRLSGDSKGLSHINISSAVVFLPFLG